MNNLRSTIVGCLLCLLLLSEASTGMRLPRETKAVWQRGKDASYEILRQLEKLDIKKPAAFETTVQFPQPIECSDSCDPDSLATTNKLPCLTKISNGLRHYHDLLAMFSDPTVPTELQNALDILLELPLLNNESGNEGRSPVSRSAVPGWQMAPLQNLTLWRLQSFGVVAARVFSHCTALA
nr:PREDICTED: interleukin-23 subunit alpha [Anolis carolinensis]|eukprot:XP_008102303.1 PREDICTED: interleukin-23 subunit alpha [Anolis carolinensis]